MSDLLYSTDGRFNRFGNRMTYITAHQRNCKKVMFSVMFGWPLGGWVRGGPYTGPWPLPTVQGSNLFTMKHGLSVIRRLTFDWNTFSFHLLPDHYFAFFQILRLITCMLLQQRIVFISSSYALLTIVMEVNVSFIYFHVFDAGRRMKRVQGS